MGVKGLFGYLRKQAPKCIQERTMSAYLGRILAVDASLCIYQFLAAVRTQSDFTNLTNKDGKNYRTTPHSPLNIE